MPESRELAERVGRLEAQGRELRRELLRIERVLDGREPEDVSEPVAAGVAGGGVGRGDAEGRRGGSLGLPLDLVRLRSGEWWLSRVGIGLLVFGVILLFEFSVEQGWITPPLRVGVGLALGALLVVLGIRAYESRRAMGQVLLGGGIGVFYVTGFAAFALYALVPYAVAFAFMVSVTLLAFALSLRQDGAALALIGTLGGLGTPFVLYDGAENVGRLALYTSVVLTGASAAYLYKGWRSLLLVASVGTWSVFEVACVEAAFPQGFVPVGDRPALQLGVAFSCGVLWLAVAARETLRSRDASRWPLPDAGAFARTVFGALGVPEAVPRGAVFLATPLVGLAFAYGIWGLRETSVGWVALSCAAVYGVVAVPIRRFEKGGRTSYAHALVSLALANIALTLILDGDALFLALAFEATALHALARRFSDGILSACGHMIFVVLFVWVLTRLLGVTASASGAAAVFNATAISDLTALVLVVAASTWLTAREQVVGYRVVAYAILLAWLWRELSMLPNGDVWVTVSWGLCGLGLVVAGLRISAPAALRTGMATLFLVVGKLFVVDLVWVEAVWRILLFLGFGGLFLALAYHLQTLWRPDPGEGSGTLATPQSGQRDHDPPTGPPLQQPGEPHGGEGTGIRR